MDSRIQQFFDEIKGKKVSVLGIGITHSDLISRMRDRGAKITAHDQRSRAQLGEALCSNLEAQDVKLRLGPDYLKGIDAQVVLRTPGMPFHSPVLEELRQNGVVVTSEMELFFDLCPCKTIGVTGSDGKTTTTTLISEILKEGGKRVHVGGNIGRPLFPVVQDIRPNDFAVAELSSFQLISMRESPDIAVITNITPNHLDIHKSMDEYVDAKRNIMRHQNAFSRTVLGVDNELVAGFAGDARGQLFEFSLNHPVRTGAYLGGDGIIYVSINGKKQKVMHAGEICLPGMHNIANLLAAICAVWGYADLEAIVNVAMEFTGVEHRIEFVRERGGVRWFNDSIATSPSRTIAGLESFEQPVILLAGGYDKQIPFTPLAPKIIEHVKTLILMGDTAAGIEKAVRECPGYKGSPEILRARNMEEAVMKAAALAKQGDIVTLSPACASFDAYPNFEERGRHFKDLVQRLG